MASIDTMNNNFKEIMRLWAPGGVSVLKDRVTGENMAFCCYCIECKKKSVSGDGGITFQTAEDLLDHRKMKAFECPCGCGYHICEEFGSIIRHLDFYHKEVLEKLKTEGLDLTTKKRVWIYPDYENGSYTLTKPEPVFEASPLENAGIILAMTPPKRIAASPSPVPAEKHHIFKKKKFVPLNMAAITEPKQELQLVKPTPSPVANIKKIIAKTWEKMHKPEVSFSQVMNEQQQQTKQIKQTTTNTEETIQPKHYAQEDMRKEKQCPYGKGCVKRDRPFACALNHDGKGDIIKRGTELTEEVLCLFERPPFKRCGDGRCTKIHLEHRADFIEQKKKQIFDADPQANMSYSVVADTLKKEKTAIITASAEGTTIQMSHEDAIAIAEALRELDQKHTQEDEEVWNQPRNLFSDSSSEETTDEDEEVEDDEDLDDPAVFAARSAIVKTS
jgi:hypothetical protein